MLWVPQCMLRMLLHQLYGFWKIETAQKQGLLNETGTARELIRVVQGRVDEKGNGICVVILWLDFICWDEGFQRGWECEKPDSVPVPFHKGKEQKWHTAPW